MIFDITLVLFILWLGKGLGRESVQLMMKFCAQKLSIKSFVAKISDKNLESRRLFESMGFVVVSHSDIFEESTLTFSTPDACEHLLSLN